MTKSGSKYLASALLAGTALPSHGLAQEVELPIPPARQTVDENGVDLSSGRLQVADPVITIGGNQGLSFRRYAPADFGVWSQQYQYAIYGPAGGAVIAVADDRSIGFDFTGGVYVNKVGTGETLTHTGSGWILTLRDGTAIELDLAGFPAGVEYKYGSKGVSGVAKKITFPAKNTLTFHYKTVNYSTLDGIGVWARLQSVVSSYGYLLKLQYAENSSPNTQYNKLIKATLINQAVDYCNPAADSCASLTQSWPTLDYTHESDIGPPITRVDKVTDALGRTTSYMGGDPIAGIRRPTSSVDDVSIGYSGGRVSSITRHGSTWTYSWNLAAPLMTATVTNPDGTQKIFITDTSIGQMKSAKDELNRTTLYDYDTKGRLTLVTFPEGNKLQYSYDARGNVTQQRSISKTPGTPADIVISASYSASCANALTCNQPNSSTDARGYVTEFTYDPTHGGVTSIKAPEPTVGAVRPETRYSYAARQAYYKNSSGSIVASGQNTYVLAGTSACQSLSSCAGAADEVKVTIDYGPQTAGTANNLLPISMTQGAGDNSLTATQTSTYDTIGNVTYTDGPLAGTADKTRVIYDAGRQVVGQVGPDPDGGGTLPNRAIRLTYDLDGQVTKAEQGTTAGQTDPSWAAFSSAEKVEIKYDTAGRVAEEKLSGIGSAVALTQYSYDALGRLECTTVRMNTAIYTSLPTSACMLGAEGSFGPDRISRTVYNVAGQPIQLQTAFGTAHRTNEWTASYTANGQIQTLTDAENNKTTYVYDGFDRLSQTQYPSATKGSGTSDQGEFEQLIYDAASNLYTRQLRSGELLQYRYDALNRLTLKGGDLTDVLYTYDGLNRLLTVKYATAAQGITNDFDALGRVTSSSNDMGGVVRTTSYEYDLAGRRTKLTYPDSGLYLNYDYLVTGEVTKIRENGATAGIGVLATYAYDNLGQRTSLTRGNGAITTYVYDAASRLTNLTHNLSGTVNDLTIGTITYNPEGQIISQPRSDDDYSWNDPQAVNRNYASNGLNQLTQSGSIVPTYDTRGNLTSAGTTTYVYNSENRLTSASGGLLANLSYDPDLRLYQVSGGGVTTRFAYDGLDIVAEYDGANLLLRRYVHGPGEDEPLVWYEGTGTTDRRWMHADERSSIVALSDGGGNLIANSDNNYDEFGIPGIGNVGRFQYTGQAWLPELGMYYYKNRIYSPSLGRFLQTDPLEYDDGLNMYSYVSNDPINLVDPSGLTQDKACLPGHAGCPPQSSLDQTVMGWRIPSAGVVDVRPGRARQPGDHERQAANREYKRRLLDGKRQRCGAQALAKNATSLGLDMVGLIPGGSTASTLALLGVGGAGIVDSAVRGDVQGLGLGIAGFHVTSAGPWSSQYRSVSRIARVIPGVGMVIGGISLANTLNDIRKDYNTCMSN